MDGSRVNLAAALNQEDKYSLVAVGDPAFADTSLVETSQDRRGWAKIVFMGNIHSDNSASVTMTDKKTGAIVFAYAWIRRARYTGSKPRD